MSDRFHIMITKDGGKARRFLLSKRKLQLSCVFIVSLFLLLSILGNQVKLLNNQLQENNVVKEELALQVQELQQLNREQTEAFQQEKATLLNTAVTELEERSGMIERIMCNLGVKVKETSKTNKNSGGPFIAPLQDSPSDLLFRSGNCLEILNSLPLGRPVPGAISSKFGHRTDPVNGKKAFHTGVDMQGRNGQKIVATADGVVTKSFLNGSYGRYIEIYHGNGYSTRFAHLKKLLVKRGDKIKRGQTIGTVGSSGRSTGPHLHYEVCLNKKQIDPGKFIAINKLTLAPVIQKSTIKIKHLLIAANQNSSKINPQN